MDFEWDSAKEQSNRKKHGVDFRTAAKVFLDLYAIEFEDREAAGELRFNVVGMVEGRLLFVSYTMRAATSASYPREERVRMKKESIMKFRVDPKSPPKTDWRDFDAMSEQERHRAALSDPDAQPATEKQLQAPAAYQPCARCAKSSI